AALQVAQECPVILEQRLDRRRTSRRVHQSNDTGGAGQPPPTSGPALPTARARGAARDTGPGDVLCGTASSSRSNYRRTDDRTGQLGRVVVRRAGEFSGPTGEIPQIPLVRRRRVAENADIF